MKIIRITMVSLPLLVVSSSAFADSEDKRKQGAAEPQAPTEEPVTEAPPPAPPAIEQPAPPLPAPPPPAPAVGTTRTTAALAESTEPKMAPKPKGSPVGDRWNLEPLIGAGTNDFNFGVGGRVGYTFAVPVYLGATFMWHDGETNESVSVNRVTESKVNFYYPAIEVGYDLGLGPEGVVVIRPYVGSAVLFDRARIATNGLSVSDTASQYMLYPGLTAHVNVPGSPLFLGADTRLVVPVDHHTPSYQGFLVAGLGM